MPRTPPIIFPTSPSGSWFSSNTEKEKENLHERLDDLNNLSPFSYSPSDDEEPSKPNIVNRQARKFYKSKSNNPSEETLYHKPALNQSSQQRVSRSNQPSQQSTSRSNQPSQKNTIRSNQQQYELVDQDEDYEESRTFDNNSVQDPQRGDDTQFGGDTQFGDDIQCGNDTQCEDDKFSSAIDDLNSEFKLYTDEYREFKRHVDGAKRELLQFIQDRTLYFEERGSYLNQKWESLRQLI